MKTRLEIEVSDDKSTIKAGLKTEILNQNNQWMGIFWGANIVEAYAVTSGTMHYPERGSFMYQGSITELIDDLQCCNSALDTLAISNLSVTKDTLVQLMNKPILKRYILEQEIDLFELTLI